MFNAWFVIILPASPALFCYVEDMGVYDLYVILFISDVEKNCLGETLGTVARFINK